MASDGRKAALERLRAARNGDVSCAEQYVVPEAKKIIQQVSEEEYRSIVADRRSDWVVGKKDSGYTDGGQELWKGKESVRQRVLEDERDRKLLAQMDVDGKKTKVVKEQAETAPAGRGAFLGALQKGAAPASNAVSNSLTKKEQNKLVDDMLEQMCGELEAESESTASQPSAQASESPSSPPQEEKDVNMIPAPEEEKAIEEKAVGPKIGTQLEAKEVQEAPSAPAEEQQPAVPDVQMEAVPEPLPNLSEDLIATGAQQQVLRDEHGGLWFFFIDAFEDDRSSPPRVYLFGKVRSVSGSFCSCCLVVENLERCIHLLLKVDPEANGEAVNAAAAAADQEFESICRKQYPNVRKLRSKLKWRNYAFEKSLPHGAGHLPFLKVVCDASGGVPRELHGQTFTHAFGMQTSLLERLVLTKQIMGPGWLRLKPGSFKNEAARLSFCAQEFRLTPNSFHWPRTEEDKTELAKLSPSASPPLRMMSLSLQTVQQGSQAPHEVLAIACTLHTNVSPDAGSEDPRRGTWAAVRRLDINPLPRDADKALAQSGMQTCNNELHLLSSFLAKVQEFDPDVVAGHNAYACDLDILASRFQQLKIHQWQKLGRLRRPKDRVPRSEGRQGQGFWVGSNLLAGRLVCDVLLQAKDLLPKMGCYDLSNLAKEQLNFCLPNVEPESIASCYSSARTLKDFVELKLHHAQCIAQLVQTLQILPLTRQLTNLAGNLWNASLQNKRAERNELLLCHEFHKKKFVLPDKESARKKKMLTDLSFMEDPDDDAQAAGAAPRRKAAAYSGGLVLAPKAGLYDDFVMLLDFNSLYPSIIQEHNICFTTVDRPDEIEVANLTTEAQLLAKTQADGMAEEGILPQVLRRLVDSRRQVKAAIKTEKNPKVLQVLEIRQKALKLTANSMYGCLGFQNSRFYAKPLAALITAKGREALQSTINVVNQELQLDVVYGDTDSVFVNTKTSNFQQAMQIGDQIKRSVNKRYKRLEIEIDGVFVRLMLLKKKKYAAMKVVDWQKQVFETEFKGLDIVRRDWCGLAKEMGEAILMQILDTKSNQEESLEWVHQFLIDKCKEMDDGKVDVSKFVITKGLTKDPKDYPDAKKQPHVQVALRLISRGKHVRPGQEIGYVICNNSGDGSKDLLAERARHPHELEMDKSLTLDIQWYKKQQVHPLVSRILAVVEGTSPARLAECIGIDAARFSQAALVRAEEGGEGLDSSMSMAADLSTFFDRKLRFKGFPSNLPGVKCSKCGEVTKWEQFLLGGAESAESKVSPQLSCPLCQHQVNLKVLRNLWFMQMRRMVKEHGEGWVRAEESSGIEKTRRSTRGQNLVSEKTVYRELEFANHLCETAKETLEEEDAAKQDTFEKMNKDAGIWLSHSSQNFVDVSHLFGSLNPYQNQAIQG